MILAIMKGRAPVDQKSLPATSADESGEKETKRTEGTHRRKLNLLKRKYLLKTPDVDVRGRGGAGRATQRKDSGIWFEGAVGEPRITSA
jgi:hypothetical protein